MTQEEVDQPVLGRGAKLAAFLVIVVAAFAMGYSSGSRNNANQDHQLNERMDEFNQSLFHSMMDGRRTATDHRPASPTAKDQVASTKGDMGLAADGK